MSAAVLVAVGAALGLLAAAFATRLRGERKAWAAGLIAAALLYLLFAAVGRAGAGALGLELTGVMAYSAVAWLGLVGSPLWLAAGWAAHVVWDVALHSGGAGGYAPAGYVELCIGFDLAVAAYIAWRCRRRQTPSPRSSSVAERSR